MAEVVYEQAWKLDQILEKPELKALLKRWDENLKQIQTSIESKRARAQAAKSEIYLLISFYLVVQGGIMNTLASKANARKCGIAYFPALFSLLAILGAGLSVHDKFRDYHTMKKKRKKDESESTILQYKIDVLLRKGESFKFEDLAVKATSTEPIDAGSEYWFLEEQHYFKVMGFLVGIFVIVCVNCKYVC